MASSPTTTLRITEVKYKSSFRAVCDMVNAAAVLMDNNNKLSASNSSNSSQRSAKSSSKTVTAETSSDRSADLHEAVKRGDNGAVEKLLRRGCDPDEPDWRGSGRAPLLESVLRRDVTTAQLLLSAGCSVDVCNSQGETALHLAVETNPICPQMVNLLLDAGADPGIADRMTGNTPLHSLVTKHLTTSTDSDENRLNVLDAISRLARHGEVEARNFSGCTALHRAITASTDDVLVSERVRALLEAGEGRGASSQNEFGETPLHSATDRRLPLTVSVLLENAADLDVNARDRYRMAALHYAANKRSAAIVGQLLGRADCDANAADLNGDTPLHLAAGKGHEEVVRILLGDARVNANAVNAKGQLPLHKAIESSFVDVVKELLRAECGVLVNTGYAVTPLDLACTEGVYRARPEISKLLLRAVQDTVDDCTINETPI